MARGAQNHRSAIIRECGRSTLLKRPNRLIRLAAALSILAGMLAFSLFANRIRLDTVAQGADFRDV